MIDAFNEKLPQIEIETQVAEGDPSRSCRPSSRAALAYVLFTTLFVITYLQLRIGRDRATSACDFE